MKFLRRRLLDFCRELSRFGDGNKEGLCGRRVFLLPPGQSSGY